MQLQWLLFKPSTKEIAMAKGQIQQGNSNQPKLTPKQKKQKKKDKADKKISKPSAG